MAQHQTRTGPIVNDAAPFTSSMVDGRAPSSPNRSKWLHSSSNVAPVDILAFSIEMVLGSKPDRSRQGKLHTSSLVAPIDVILFPFESTFGTRPPSRSSLKVSKGPSFFPWSGTQAPFNQEMISGSNVIRPSIKFIHNQGWVDNQLTFASDNQEWLGRSNTPVGRFPKLSRQGLQLDQVNHIPSPFTQDMVAGSNTRPRPVTLHFLGWIDNQLTFASDAQEWISRLGAQSPHLPKLSKQGWQDSQITHVQAPFSQEMISGFHPDRNRSFVYPKLGWSDSQLTFQIQMTPEMFKGNYPDKPRLFLAPKIDLPLSQTSPTQAPFTQDMVAGYHPDRGRFFRVQPLGIQLAQPHPVDIPPEEVFGYHPDKPRLFIYPKLGLQISQTTHVSAPFTSSMVDGKHPDSPNLRKPKPLGWIQHPFVNTFNYILSLDPGTYTISGDDAALLYSSGAFTLPYEMILTFVDEETAILAISPVHSVILKLN